MFSLAFQELIHGKLLTSSNEYHKCVITIPVLDQLISEFNDRFDEYNSKALIALKLLPPSMYELDEPLTDKDLRDLSYMLGLLNGNKTSQLVMLTQQLEKF